MAGAATGRRVAVQMWWHGRAEATVAGFAPARLLPVRVQSRCTRAMHEFRS
jgi:hypothetical protein